MKLNNFGENLGWSCLTQTRVRSSQMLGCEYGNVWCLKMDQWVFFFILSRLWFSLVHCVAQTVCRVCSHLLTLAPGSRIFLPWRWRRYVPPKRRFTQDLHGATSKKTAFFIVTTVKTSNLTCNWNPSYAFSKERYFHRTELPIGYVSAMNIFIPLFW
jgi:hypothetical protein